MLVIWFLDAVVLTSINLRPLNCWPLPEHGRREPSASSSSSAAGLGQVGDVLAAGARAMVRAGGVHLHGEAGYGAVWPLLPCGRRPSTRVHPPGRRHRGRRAVRDPLRRHQAAARRLSPAVGFPEGGEAFPDARLGRPQAVWADGCHVGDLPQRREEDQPLRLHFSSEVTQRD